MREILFRAQTRRKGERVRLDGTPVDSNWVYGGILQGEGDFSVIYQTEPEIEKYPVYTDTICQYTGLTDKNGKKIFEGDIVKKEFYTDYDAYMNSKEYIGVVKYEDCAWVTKSKDCTYPIFMGLSESQDAEHYIVIGNVFDNADLLKESEGGTQLA